MGPVKLAVGIEDQNNFLNTNSYLILHLRVATHRIPKGDPRNPPRQPGSQEGCNFKVSRDPCDPRATKPTLCPCLIIFSQGNAPGEPGRCATAEHPPQDAFRKEACCNGTILGTLRVYSGSSPRFLCRRQRTAGQLFAETEAACCLPVPPRPGPGRGSSTAEEESLRMPLLTFHSKALKKPQNQTDGTRKPEVNRQKNF